MIGFTLITPKKLADARLTAIIRPSTRIYVGISNAPKFGGRDQRGDLEPLIREEGPRTSP